MEELSKSSDPKISQVAPTTEKNQRSIDLNAYLWRYIPQFQNPTWWDGEAWRIMARSQPIAMICRQTLIDYLLALDWKILPRDSNKRDELRSEIDYYTRLMEDNGDIEFSNHLEWICQDFLDLPFGAASEIGREGDIPTGKVLWYIPMDGATLFPTLNNDYPVAQMINGTSMAAVPFPRHAVARMYAMPRTDIRRKGWGMAPPEVIYLILEMLNRGDQYYANLLLDTPPAGLLDLGDMAQETALEWLTSFRKLMTGIDPFKIPVLYEHTEKASFVPFAQNPSALLYDKVTLKLAAIVASAYGMSLSDIGLSSATNGGDTLAGTIRQERKTRKTGQAVLKRKTTAYFNRFLPETLRFAWIDPDEEVQNQVGRARLANATAANQAIQSKLFTPEEWRLQFIEDGLITIPVPEKKPESKLEKEMEQAKQQPFGGKKPPERPGSLGVNPVSPSQGGWGERSMSAEQSIGEIFRGQFEQSLGKLTGDILVDMTKSAVQIMLPQVQIALSELSTAEEFAVWRSLYDLNSVQDDELVRMALDDLDRQLDPVLDEHDWWKIDANLDLIVAALAVAYADVLRSTNEELQKDLIAGGYPTDGLQVPVINLTNPVVLESLMTQAIGMVNYINNGTRYYLKRILLSKARDGLTSDLIKSKILEGVDINAVLGYDEIIQNISQSVFTELKSLAEERIQYITSYEIASAENSAKMELYKRSGLTMKVWEHVGADVPCEICQENEAAGYVPLEFSYRSVFGETKDGPAHPNEHCTIRHQKQDLLSTYGSSRFRWWNGG